MSHSVVRSPRPFYPLLVLLTQEGTDDVVLLLWPAQYGSDEAYPISSVLSLSLSLSRRLASYPLPMYADNCTLCYIDGSSRLAPQSDSNFFEGTMKGSWRRTKPRRSSSRLTSRGNITCLSRGARWRSARPLLPGFT